MSLSDPAYHEGTQVLGQVRDGLLIWLETSQMIRIALYLGHDDDCAWAAKGAKRWEDMQCAVHFSSALANCRALPHHETRPLQLE